ncbi:hypothetical protein DXG01_008318, partial [Tephrocybe rancida]
PSTPQTNEEILRAIRTASEKDLAVFISCVVVSADGLIWVSTTTSEGAQSFSNLGALGGLWDYATNEEMDCARKNAAWEWESPQESPSPPQTRVTAVRRLRPLRNASGALARTDHLGTMLEGSIRGDVRDLLVPDPQITLADAGVRALNGSREPEGKHSVGIGDMGGDARRALRTEGTEINPCQRPPGTPTGLGPERRALDRAILLTAAALGPDAPPLPSLLALIDHEVTIASVTTSSTVQGESGDETAILDKTEEIVLQYAKALRETIAAHRAGAELTAIPQLHNVEGTQARHPLDERMDLDEPDRVRQPLDERMDLDRPSFLEWISEPTVKEGPPQVMERFGVQLEDRVAEPGIAPPKKKRHRSGKKERAKLDRVRAHQERETAEAAFFGGSNS